VCIRHAGGIKRILDLLARTCQRALKLNEAAAAAVEEGKENVAGKGTVGAKPKASATGREVRSPLMTTDDGD
jgi:hypothetical protein